MKKIRRLTIENTGGEYIAGIITNQNVKNNLRSAIKSGGVRSTMDFEDGSVFSTSNYNDILFAYGPDDTWATVELEESKDVDVESDWERDYRFVLSENIDDTPIKSFVSSRPSSKDIASNFSSDDLIVFNQSTEKRIRYPVVFELNGDDEFDLACVYVGTMCMSQAIDNATIVDEILYIPNEKAAAYLKEHLGEDMQDHDTLDEHLTDIFLKSPELRDKIRTNHKVRPGDIEGKGEWENDYVKVTTLDGEVLFEDGEY